MLKTPLMYACEKRNLAVAKLLLEYRADIDLQSYDEDTALIMAVSGSIDNIEENGNKEIVELLLKQGANANLQNEDGYTALLIAVSSGNKEIVQLLLENGADINIKNIDGKTAWSLAEERNYSKIVDLLKNISRKEGWNYDQNYPPSSHNGTFHGQWP